MIFGMVDMSTHDLNESIDVEQNVYSGEQLQKHCQ
jgi:hypothetical protein